MAATSGFKSLHQSSSAAPFLTPLTISYTCQHSCILPAFQGCHSKSRQVWPHGMEPIISKFSHRRCNQRELLPSYMLGWSHSHPPGSKHGHSYLTYLWNQLKVIDMFNDCGWLWQRLAAKLLLCKTALNGPAPCVPFPSSDWLRTPYIFFSLIFPGHSWVLDPITNPHLPPPLTLAAPCYKIAM